MLSFLVPSGYAIYNEDFTLFDSIGYGYLMVFLFSIAFMSIYHATTFIVDKVVLVSSLVGDIAEKNRSRFFRCGSYDQHDMQSLNDCI